MKFFYSLILIVLLSVIIFLGIAFSESHREYKVFKKKQAKLEAKLNQARKTYQEQENYINRFYNDPLFFKWVVRQKYGTANSDEIIFRFNESSPIP